VTKDEGRAVELFQTACDAGWPTACAYLGETYFKGIGVKRDVSRALKLYMLACDKNSAQGCFELGAVLAEGNQVTQSYEHAAALYQRACDLDATSAHSELEGASKACTNLGLLYEYGRGVRADRSRAVDLYERGCQDGNPIGCLNAGNMYSRGWAQLDKSCTAGKAQDCYVAGLMLDIGDIVAGDRDRAIALHRAACQKKYEASCVELKRIEQLPPPAAPHPEQKESCQEQCKRLFADKGLRDGITAENCIAQTCGP